MSAAKIDHKELQRRLKEDEVQVYLSELKENSKKFFDEYGKSVVMAAAIIIILTLAYYYWQSQQQTAFEDRQILFGNAVGFIQQGMHEPALESLDELLSNYPNSSLAGPAAVLQGDCYVKTDQVDKALDAYQKAMSLLTHRGDFAARIGVVQSLRDLGQTDTALEHINAMLNEARSDEFKHQLLFLQASCYEDNNQPDQAIEVYEQIPSNSSWYSFAMTRVEWLKAQPVEAIN